MENKEQTQVMQVAKGVISILPLLTLIWGAAVVYTRVMDNTRRIDQLESKQETSIDRLTAQVADMNLSIKELQTEVRLLRKE